MKNKVVFAIFTICSLYISYYYGFDALVHIVVALLGIGVLTILPFWLLAFATIASKSDIKTAIQEMNPVSIIADCFK